MPFLSYEKSCFAFLMMCLTSLEQADKVSALGKDCLGATDDMFWEDLIAVDLGV